MLYRDEIQRLKDTDKEWRNLRINKNKDTPALQDLPLKRRYFWENM